MEGGGGGGEGVSRGCCRMGKAGGWGERGGGGSKRGEGGGTGRELRDKKSYDVS